MEIEEDDGGDGGMFESVTGFCKEDLLVDELDELDSHLVDELVNDSDYVGRKLSTNVSVPGNIGKPQFREFWLNKLKPSDLVKEVVTEGYKLPFKTIPPPSFEGNNRSARNDMSFVRAEIERLEKLGCISRVEDQPYLVLPLSSVYSKKKRLVVDGSRALNPFLHHRRVRLQDHREVSNFVKSGDWFTVDDLDSGYWHIPIHPDHRQYLGVAIEDEVTEKTIFFTWNVLFLGISDAVFLFTAVLKPIKIYVISLGIPCLSFIDDILCSGKNQEESSRNRTLMVEVLSRAGFVVSEKKSKGPDQRILFLGLEICSVTKKFYIPEEKLVRIIEELESLLMTRRIKLRNMARILGLLQSCSRALGNVVKIRSRNLYRWLNELLVNSSYNHHFPLSEIEKEEISFWIKNIRDLNGCFFSPKLSSVETYFSVVSDASKDGLFAYQLEDKYEILLRRLFSAQEAKCSSTVREILALQNIYCSEFSDRFKGATVYHYTDNQAVPVIVEVGSKKPQLQEIALNIFEACKSKEITLIVEWKPREHPLLQHADLGSKSFDLAAYSLDFQSFVVILEYFDVWIEVDCMSNYWNRKAEIFFSKTEELGAAGVNFFCQSLNANTSYYCFPPPSMILPTIFHFYKFRAHGLLVVPVWKSASFWINLVPDGKHFPSWVTQFLIFRPTGFVVDEAIRSSTFRNPVKFDILVMKFDFMGITDDELFKSVLSKDKCLDDPCVGCDTN